MRSATQNRFPLTGATLRADGRTKQLPANYMKVGVGALLTLATAVFLNAPARVNAKNLTLEVDGIYQGPTVSQGGVSLVDGASVSQLWTFDTVTGVGTATETIVSPSDVQVISAASIQAPIGPSAIGAYGGASPLGFGFAYYTEGDTTLDWSLDNLDVFLAQPPLEQFCGLRITDDYSARFQSIQLVSIPEPHAAILMVAGLLTRAALARVGARKGISG